MASNRSRKRRDARSQPKIYVVHAHDVLNGRGVNIAQHPGNERFRSLIKTRQDEHYCSDFTTEMKKALASEVITHIKNLDPPGRFLKRDGASQSSRGLEGPWEELTEREASKKATQALRDCNRTDRTGYAAQVKAPPDVEVTAEERERSGLSLKDYAANKVEEGSKQPIGGNKNNNCSSNRKRPPPSASRNTTKRTSRGSSPAHDFKKQQLGEPLPAFSQDESFAAPLELPTSTAYASATVEATPGPPHDAPVPVSQTPGPYRQSYMQPRPSDYGFPLYSNLYSGSSHPPMMPPSSTLYHPGDTSHHQFAPEDSNSVAASAHPAPYSPLVRSNPPQHGNDHTEEALRLPIGDFRQTLFGTEDDEFACMAANADAGLHGGTSEDAFDMIHDHDQLNDHHNDGSNDNWEQPYVPDMP